MYIRNMSTVIKNKNGALSRSRINFRSSGTGFTLVELLVVVAIIGLLAAIILVNLGDVRAKARDRRRIADAKQIAEALALYHDDNQAYPVYGDPDGFITGSDPVSTELLSGGHMNSIPLDPLNQTVDGVTYKYSYNSSAGRTFELTYCLETDSVEDHDAGCGVSANNIIVP